MTTAETTMASQEQGMKIHVSRVPAEGLQEHATYEPAELDMAREDVRITAPFEADAAVALADRELVVQAEIRATLQQICARCLEEFTTPLTLRQVFSYAVRPGDVVDITDDVRQEIMLAYPLIPVCAPGCRGLCGACGQNLNRASCAHAEAQTRDH